MLLIEIKCLFFICSVKVARNAVTGSLHQLTELFTFNSVKPFRLYSKVISWISTIKVTKFEKKKKIEIFREKKRSSRIPI